MTFRKLINFFKVIFSYFLAVFFKCTYRYAYPYSISIEPNLSCNLKCPGCAAGSGALNREEGEIDFVLFKKIVNELSPYLTNLILYFQGEPFLHRSFFKLIEYASITNKIFTTTSTNGHFLNKLNCKKIIESGLDEIIISIDGTTQKIYERYRVGGSLGKVLSGIENLVSHKNKLKSKSPFIILQFIVFKHNEHQIDDFKKLSVSLKVDRFQIKSAQIQDYKTNSNLIPSINKYSRYKREKNGKYIIKSKLKNRCLRLFNSAVITWNGDVLPCCFDKNADFTFGNVKDSSFKKINKNSLYRNFRKKVFSGRKHIQICINCTEGLS